MHSTCQFEIRQSELTADRVRRSCVQLYVSCDPGKRVAQTQNWIAPKHEVHNVGSLGLLHVLTRCCSCCARPASTAYRSQQMAEQLSC